MRLDIFCGPLLNLRTEILRFPETLCFDFFPRKSFEAVTLRRRCEKCDASLLQRFRKKTPKIIKGTSGMSISQSYYLGRLTHRVFRTGISRVVQGHPLPYFTYATTHTNKTITQHYYSYLVVHSAHWSRPTTEMIEQWSYCVFLNFLPRPPGDLKTQLFCGDQKRSEGADEKVINLKNVLYTFTVVETIQKLCVQTSFARL